MSVTSHDPFLSEVFSKLLDASAQQTQQISRMAANSEAAAAEILRQRTQGEAQGLEIVALRGEVAHLREMLLLLTRKVEEICKLCPNSPVVTEIQQSLATIKLNAQIQEGVSKTFWEWIPGGKPGVTTAVLTILLTGALTYAFLKTKGIVP